MPAGGAVRHALAGEQMDDAVNDVLDRVTLAMLAEVSRQRGNPECVL
ncbi:MAG: hypothetical protein ACLSWY_05585 [Ruthenibacterium lactatiformans]